jgi:hypothetical protein
MNSVVRRIFLPNQGSIATFLLLLVFALIPFQKRFHGYFDSLSRSLQVPNFPLPEFFSRKIHLFISDLVIVIFVLYLFFVCKQSLYDFFWKESSKYLTILTAILLLSTTLSVTKNHPIQYIKLCQFSLIFLFFNSLRCVCSKVNISRFVYKLAWVLVCLSLFECAISIAQYFTQDAVGFKIFGERNPKAFPFANPGHSLGFLTDLLGFRQNSSFLYRVSGTFLHPNILGGFLLCSILATYYLFLLTKHATLRIALSCMVLLQFFALYLSFSRAALLATLFSTFIWLYLQWKASKKSKSWKIVLGIVCCSACVGSCLLYPQLRARGGIFNTNANSLGADTERITYMKAAAKMIEERPLLGVGYNNFQIHAQRLQTQFPNNYLHSKVHNIYLLVTSEAGLIGGGIFLLYICSLLKASWRGLRKVASLEEFQAKAFLASLFLGLLLIGGCDFYSLETPQGSIPFFGIAGLLAGMNTQFFQSCNEEKDENSRG